MKDSLVSSFFFFFFFFLSFLSSFSLGFFSCLLVCLLDSLVLINGITLLLGKDHAGEVEKRKNDQILHLNNVMKRIFSFA